MLENSKVIDLVKEYYDLHVQVKELPGYDEWNYLLTTDSDVRYVLKANRGTSSESALYAQNEAMEYLEKKGMSGYFPSPIRNVNHRTITEVSFPEESYYIRLLSYLPGTFLAETKGQSDTLLRNYGTFIGTMDTILDNFTHAGARRYIDWDIQHTLDWRKYLPFITSHENRRIASYFLMQFEEIVLPVNSGLRRKVIHNDVNDWNLLVDGETGDITGLIDFGDIVYAPVINNIAIALSYIMMGKEDPLRVACYVLSNYHQQYPLQEEEVDLLYYLIAARLCLSVLHSAYQRSSGSTNEHHFLSEKQAWKLLHDLLRTNPLKAQQEFRNACGMKRIYHEEDNYKNLIERRHKHVGKNLSLAYQNHLKIIRGGLQYLYDDKGRAFLDCVNNVSHVGHNHPRLVKAMHKQVSILNTNTRYLHDDLIEYAEELTATLPPELEVCFFVNSGSEANDLAVRMARHFTGNKDVIVLDHAYHGTSSLAMQMSPYKFDGKGGFQQADFIHKAINPDIYRGKYRGASTDVGKKYAENVRKIIEQLKSIEKKPAAFICESLLGVGGQIPLPDGYLQEVYQLIRSAGGVTIADEVQVGFGRVGTHFWGFELQDVVPDIVVLGKPMGNGHPLAAVVVKKEIADAFNNGMEYFNTFGGNPVSMRTGRTVLKIIEEENLQQNAMEVGNYLLEKLEILKDKHMIIGDVRGRGLFLGVEFIKDRLSLEPEAEILRAVVEEMKNRGILLSTDGPHNNVLKIKPPIIFSKANADELIKTLDEVLNTLID